MLKLSSLPDTVMRSLEIVVVDVLAFVAIAGHGSNRGGPARREISSSTKGSSSVEVLRGRRLSFIKPAL